MMCRMYLYVLLVPTVVLVYAGNVNGHSEIEQQIFDDHAGFCVPQNVKLRFDKPLKFEDFDMDNLLHLLENLDNVTVMERPKTDLLHQMKQDYPADISLWVSHTPGHPTLALMSPHASQKFRTKAQKQKLAFSTMGPRDVFQLIGTKNTTHEHELR